MHVYNRCVMAAFCGPWLLESNLLWMICIFFWNLYLDSTSKEGRRLRLAPPEGMHALHREREGHLFLGLQFPPCCWVRWVMISLLSPHFLEIPNYNFCFVLMNCILGGLLDLEIATHTHTCGVGGYNGFYTMVSVWFSQPNYCLIFYLNLLLWYKRSYDFGNRCARK